MRNLLWLRAAPRERVPCCNTPIRDLKSSTAGQYCFGKDILNRQNLAHFSANACGETLIDVVAGGIRVNRVADGKDADP
jgi:hypothetical protein